MKYIYKIIRFSAWVLVLITVLVLISGLAPFKSFLFPKFLQLNSIQHGQLAIFGFLPFFFIHSLGGIIILMTRHKKLNKNNLKIVAGIIWFLINGYFAYAYLYQIPLSSSNQNIPNNNQPSVQNNGQPLSLSAAEVARHNKINDCWMIINGSVYNLSNYSSAHLGGLSTIAKYCGQDGSIGFNTKDQGQPHSSNAASLLDNYYLGKLGETIQPTKVETTNTQNPPSNNREFEEEDDD